MMQEEGRRASRPVPDSVPSVIRKIVHSLIMGWFTLPAGNRWGTLVTKEEKELPQDLTRFIERNLD